MSETPLQREIHLRLGSRPDVRLFRNNQGVAREPTADGRTRYIRYGVCNPGGSDLIGWRQVVVTPDMVGKKVALFLAVEVKTPGARTKKDRAKRQADFRNAVQRAGGIAIVATSPEDADAAIGG